MSIFPVKTVSPGVISLSSAAIESLDPFIFQLPATNGLRIGFPAQINLSNCGAAMLPARSRACKPAFWVDHRGNDSGFPVYEGLVEEAESTAAAN